MKKYFQNLFLFVISAIPVIPAPACNSYAVSIAGRKAGIYLNRFPIKSGMTNESPGMTRKGQSLIEILIAISAITIVLTALVSSATRSLSGSVSARTQALATKLAEDQMEKVRAYRDRNGLSLLLDCTTPVKCSLDSGLNKSYSPLIVENYLTVWWEITVPGSCPLPVPPQPNPVQVTSYAQWIDGKGTHQAKSVSCFSLWQ